MSRSFAGAWYVLGAILLLIPAPALFSGFTNYALFFSCILGAGCLALPAIAGAVSRRGERIYRASRAVFLTLFFAFVAYFSAVSVLMAHSALRPQAEAGCDIVILGSGTDGSEPDMMLKCRLDTAAEYLKNDPDARAVCCGGKGNGKEYSEAEVMKNYLMELGIDGGRIFTEEKSASTRENLMYAAELLTQLGESRPLAVCTSNFHIYRAAEFASRAGLKDVGVLPAPTPAHILPAYWVREFFGISRMWLLGY